MGIFDEIDIASISSVMARKLNRYEHECKVLEFNSPSTYLVCPHCKCNVTSYRFITDDGVTIDSYTCSEHNDIIPIKVSETNFQLT